MYKVSKKIFRKYDIRGIVPTELNPGVVYKIAKNFNRVFKRGSKILVGMDARLSSKNFKDIFIMGLDIGGIEAIDVGLITTPMLTYLVNKFEDADGGVIITASHNPSKYNGIKVVDKSGADIGGKEILKKIGISKLNEKINFSEILEGGIEGDADNERNEENLREDLIESYVNFLTNNFRPKKKLKVIMDASDGSAGPILIKLNEKIGNKVELILLNCKPNGLFPSHGPDPTIEGALSFIKDAVIETGADLGVVLDADGDRAVFIADDGEVVEPENIWRLLLINYKFSKSVTDIISSFAAIRIINDIELKHNIKTKLYVTKVGRTYIPKEMRKRGAGLGFEYSSHFYFEDFWYSDSGIFAAIKTIQAISELPYSLSRFSKLVPKTYKSEEIDFSDGGTVMKKLEKIIEKKYSKLGEISKLDGISLFAKRFSFNIRRSNTQDKIRINVMGYSESIVEKIKRELIKYAKEIENAAQSGNADSKIHK